MIIDAVRTPVGRRGGRLSGWHPVDLAAQPLLALVERNSLDPELIDDVIMGCTMTVGDQAMNIARSAPLAAGFSITVPGTTVDRQCGSAQQAIHFAAQAIIAGAMDVVIAGGVESMSRVPIGSTTDRGPGEPYGPMYKTRFELVHQGECAERIAARWGISRAQMDAFALESHRRAAIATDSGHFKNEIVALETRYSEATQPASLDAESHRDDVRYESSRPLGLLDFDEGIRRDSTLAKLRALAPVFFTDGTVTAATSSQISDGAAAVLVMSEQMAKSLRMRPRARFHSFVVAADDPEMMLTAPIPATHAILSRSNLTLDDIDVIEINEAFASVVLAWEREFNPDMGLVNPNGGAIAIGHPTGCSGARLMATLVNELERVDGRYGLQVMCEGGGQANATIIERLR